MPSTPVIFSIFSDDVRQEMDGKVSLIGVYQGGMNVNGVPPVGLPKLVVSTYILLPPDQRLESMSMQLTFGDQVLQDMQLTQSQLKEAAASAKSVPGIQELGINAVVVLQPFVIARNGVLQVKGVLDGENLIGNGLSINFTAPPPQIIETVPSA